MRLTIRSAALRICLLLVFLQVALALSSVAQSPVQPVALMPQAQDHTSMWWKDGFPGAVNGAPWQRVIQTGRYALVVDTEKLEIPHFGPLPNKAGDSARLDLPPAKLDLAITLDDKTYRGTAGGTWSKHAGPRLVESGRFFQRADVTDLVFTADDGARLNVEARFETAAWPDRLALILAARPGLLPIPAGENSFGRVRGGFGLDGSNHFEVPLSAEQDPEQFTLEFWAFIPHDYQASDHSPWLVCKNRNEVADGNFGILIRRGGVPQARLNIGGGRDNAFTLEPDSRLELRTETWHHLAISYDGDSLRLYANGRMAGEQQIGRQRVPLAGALAFGRRQDNSGDGYRFRGVVDEVRLYDRALSLQELRLHYVKPELDRPALKPIAEWTFREEGRVSMSKLREQWNDGAMEIALTTPEGEMRQDWKLPEAQSWSGSDFQQVALAFNPVDLQAAESTSPVTVQASEVHGGAPRPVDYDATLGWHRINLDGIEPIEPPGSDSPSNDAIERVKLLLSNPSDREQMVRLMFEKTARGFRQRIGTPITGISAILRDRNGNPTGIPVQLSKNWHNDPEGGVYSGQWFHGISQVRLPPATTVELELTLAYGHWGGVPAASHAQLSLIGWGGNQLWDQSAIGSWGESICFEPDQIQRGCTIMDVRPVMVRSTGRNEQWGWTNNVGGGDFFRLFEATATRIPHSAMRTTYHRQGPCLTEVTYAGRIGEGLTHATTVSLVRSDDVVRGTYRIRLDANQPTEFSRFVIFQIGADTYSASGERKMAIGNETGLLKEWPTQWGGDIYRSDPLRCSGRIPWASLHEAVPGDDQKPGAWANRSIVIREWKARLGGKEAQPWIAERGLDVNLRTKSSTLDILPPPGITRLEAGDFVEATIEHIIVPQFTADYYGPNLTLREALARDENTWRMIQREALGNDRQVEVSAGRLERLYPDIRIHAQDGSARLSLKGGLGYVALTFTGLDSNRAHQVRVDGQVVDQSIHGKDFWQTDYDATTQTWSRTYNLPFTTDGQSHDIELLPLPKP